MEKVCVRIQVWRREPLLIYNNVKNKNILSFSASQVADLLDVSRITIFRWIKDGSLKADKVGRNYIISREEFLKHLEKHPLDDSQKSEIKKLVTKIVTDYGETIRMLGGE